MQATVVITQNPFYPLRGRVVKTVCRHRRIDKLAPKTTLPFVCRHNGQYVLRQQWSSTRLQDGDVLEFITLPKGGGGEGGGKNPLATIATLALLVYAPMLAGQLSYALGGGMFLGSATGLAILEAGITIGGMALINAVLPPPKAPTPQQAASIAAPSPTYSLQAQGNSARLGSVIPVQYGRHISYPDFAAQPYGDFAGNEQYLYQLFCIGQGEYDIESIRFEETLISVYDEVTYEVIGPGGSVTLFPTNVVTSGEVSGQEALTGVELGPFVATGAGITANYIAVDMVCPRGLYYANSDGSFASKSVTFTVSAREIDNAGAPLGAWAVLGTETITAATNTPQRVSFRYAVVTSRYEVKLVRDDIKDESTRAGHELDWAGLRSYIPGSQAYGNVTMLAMRTRATNNVSQASSRKVNVTATRKLPIWNGTTWSAPTATRSIAWAIADACRNTDYGARIADVKLPLDDLLVLDATWALRGDHFDARFDNAMTFWEALQQIARAGRAKPIQQSGMVYVIRDQEQITPVAMFTPRNTVKGSLKVDYIMPTPETADAVEVEFFNAEIWAQDRVVASLPGSTESTPAKVQLFGVTDRNQAWREGMYIAACNRYRRKPITLTTEMEGFIPTFGDLVSIGSERLTAAQFGEITAWNIGTLTATLSEPVTFGVGTHYMALRKRDGGFSGPWVVTAGATSREVVFAVAPDMTPYTGSREERTHFSFGIATEYRQLAVVLGTRPRGHQVEMSFVGEYIDGSGAQYVHHADEGTVPAPLSAWQLPSLFADPTTPTGVAISETLVEAQGIVRTRMDVTWNYSAANAGYRVSWRVGTGEWSFLPDVAGTTASLLDSPVGTIEVRVVAVNDARESAPATATAILLGKAAPPSDVTNFRIDGDTLYWDEIADLDLAGYEVRFNYGQNAWWESATPMHSDLLLASPWSMGAARPSGTVTLLIKAIDTSGNYSTSAAQIVLSLGDQIATNLLIEWPQAPVFAGTIVGGSVIAGELVANATDLLYGPDTEPFYGPDTEPLYPTSTYAELQYEFSIVTPEGLSVAGDRLLLQHNIQGPFVIEYRRDDQSAFYGADNDLLYGPDTEPLYGSPGVWTVWPGSIEIRATEEIFFRVTVAAGSVQGVIIELTPQVDAVDVVETIDDQVIVSGGARLAITKTYRVIKNVQITLQDDGNNAIGVRILDKDATLGPLIRAFNDTNTPVASLVDATIQGY